MSEMLKPSSMKFYFDTAIDVHNGVIFLDDEIADDTVARFRIGFTLLKDMPITLVLNSPGGDIFGGMAIIDMIKAHKHPVRIHVNGMAASMACVLLQAATHRTASPNSVLMHHIGSIGVPDGHFANVKKLVAFTEKYNERINKIMLDRINEKRAKTMDEDGKPQHPRTMAWFKERDMVDQWMTAEDAIELGLLDEITNGYT